MKVVAAIKQIAANSTVLMQGRTVIEADKLFFSEKNSIQSRR
jgi:hypothetical protein